MEMSYIAIHRWNETVGMKVLGMSDALMSDVAYFVSPPSSSRLPRIGKGQSFPLLPSGFRIGRPWPLSLSRLFLSSFQKNSKEFTYSKVKLPILCNFCPNRIKKELLSKHYYYSRKFISRIVEAKL